jgi:hypothetical protein
VGVHSPEFAFERVPDNVRAAVKRLGVRYPVALDNDFATWRAYSNDYWPADYLIDRSGRIRDEHYGEGAYAQTESAIRRLLGEKVAAARTAVPDQTPTDITTGETYLGYARIENLANRTIDSDASAEYAFPARLGRDQVAFSGRWTIAPSRAVAGENARLRLAFQANNVFLVLSGMGRVDALVDGAPVRTITVSGTPRLYTIARYAQLTRGLLELRFSPGVAGYAFTFG